MKKHKEEDENDGNKKNQREVIVKKYIIIKEVNKLVNYTLAPVRVIGVSPEIRFQQSEKYRWVTG